MNCKTQIKDENGLYCSQIGTFISFLSISLIISNEERFNRDIQQQSNIFKDKPKSKKIPGTLRSFTSFAGLGS